MKNVFDNSSDSEPDTAPPPPKKFRPPIEAEKPVSSVKVSDDALDLSEHVQFGSHKQLEVSKENSIDFNISSDSYELDEDFEAPRFGLGAEKEEGVYNQQKSLNESILDERSVGYQIMKRMGFQPGQTIGAAGNASALSEPLPVHLKVTRAGLGIASFEPKSASQITSGDTTVFKDSVKKKANTRSERILLAKLQKFCFAASGEYEKVEQGLILEDEVNPLWRGLASQNRKKSQRAILFGESTVPRNLSSQESNSPNKDELSPEEVEVKLQELISYSRDHYNYCPFCGVKYESNQDLLESCPGGTSESHQI